MAAGTMQPPDPDMLAHLDELAAVYRHRLRILDVQRARFGPALPSHIQLEYEDAARDLARTLAELRRLRPTSFTDQAPYVGLSTFQEADADRFFGRDALIAQLVAQIEQSPFLAVLGPSGSGKSSVVRAGLIPALKGGILPDSQHWQYLTFRPGARPLNALAAALTTLEAGTLGDAATIRTTLATGTNGLLLAADMLRSKLEVRRLVLVIDQAEELWTLAPTDEAARQSFVREEQRPFIDLLLTATSAPDTPILIVLTMRADFLHRAAEHPALAAAIAQHDVIVSPMTAEEVRSAIVRPAEAIGATFEPGLVEALLAQTVEREGALPLLEYTLLALWENRHPDETLRWETLHELGGVEGGLARRADGILETHYMYEQRERLRAVLLRLIQPGEGAADTRRRVVLADIAPANSTIGEIQTLVQPLIDARLLTSGRDAASGAETIELAHEALIRAWPTLQGWIAEARADLRLQLQLEAAAQEWAAHDNSPDFLWNGLRLATIVAWVARAQPLLCTRDQAFLSASEAQEQQREAERAHTTQRLRQLVIGLVGVLSVTILALIAAGVFGVQATERAAEVQNQRATAVRSAAEAQTAQAETQTQLRVAESQQLAFAAQSQATERPETALLLAYEASMRDNNSVSEQTLRNTLDVTLWRPTTLQGHSAAVWSAVFSPDRQRILTASQDNTARLWDREGQLLAILEGHSAAVLSAVFSPNGQRILTASQDNTTRLWDREGQPLAILTGHSDPVLSAVFSPDGQRILTASSDSTVRLWDLSGQPLATLSGHIDQVQSAVFSPDGQHILTASWDGTARLWDREGQPLATLSGHTSAVLSAVFSPNGQRILTASWDKTARLWDLSGQSLATLSGHIDQVRSAVFSPDGQRILTASSDGTARLWDLSGQPLATLEGHTFRLQSAVFSPVEQRILTASVDGTARLWDLSGHSLATLSGHIDQVQSAVFSPDGQRILTASWDNTARLWDLSGQPLATLTGHTKAVQSAVFSPDGQHILTASEDGTARLWDLSGQPIATLTDHTKAVLSAVFSPDGQHILTASEDGTARLWDLSGQPLVILTGHAKAVQSAAFSPDGQRILTASWDNTVRLWDLSGQPLATLTGHTKAVMSAVFSPDGQHILTASEDGTAKLWDLSGQPLATLTGHTKAVMSVVFSLDGQHILTASADKTARLWDLSGQLLAILEGHSAAVLSAVFSPNGQRILSASIDGTARLWDASGHPFSTLRGHTSAVLKAVFSPDGQRILTASADGTARQYLAHTNDLLPVTACRVGRGLTDEEIARFQVPTPLAFDITKRQCPPVLGSPQPSS